MPKFYPGQRVRIINATQFINMMYIGKETVIDRYSPFRDTIEYDTKKEGYLVEIWVDLEDGRRFQLGYQEHELEPIIEDDGRQVTSWDKCLWNPDMIKETV